MRPTDRAVGAEHDPRGAHELLEVLFGHRRTHDALVALAALGPIDDFEDEGDGVLARYLLDLGKGLPFPALIGSEARQPDILRAPDILQAVFPDLPVFPVAAVREYGDRRLPVEVWIHVGG